MVNGHVTGHQRSGEERSGSSWVSYHHKQGPQYPIIFTAFLCSVYICFGEGIKMSYSTTGHVRGQLGSGKKGVKIPYSTRSWKGSTWGHEIDHDFNQTWQRISAVMVIFIS